MKLFLVLLLIAAGAFLWLLPPSSLQRLTEAETPKIPEKIPLVQEGASSAVIVIASNAGQSLATAAQTLQRYLETSTGARLPIVKHSGGNPAIHIGRTDEVGQMGVSIEGLDEDGFLLEGRDGDQFVILGGSDWGTEFGVYEFLERYLGVRWLLPGADGEVVPVHRDLVIPGATVRQNPVYHLSRTISGALTGEKDGIEWARLNRIRFGRLARAHNLNRLLPVSRFGKTNPEFYPTLKGKHFLPPNDVNHQWQPNFSAPGIVDAAAGEIDRYFKENPTETSYSLSTNDTANFDESPASLARRIGKKNHLGFEDTSNDYFPWANAVVEKVLQKHPDRWFGAYAYRETLEPPTHGTLNPRLVPHITYERLKWSDPQQRAADQELTKRWSKVAPTLGWYDYVYGIPYLLPRVWFHLMGDYLKWGAEHHVRSFHGDYLPNWSGEGPKVWLMAKLLWNPDQDVDALLDDWYLHAVGPAAAPKLKAHFALWEKFWTEEIRQSNWYKMEGGDGALYMKFSDPGYLSAVPQAHLQESTRLLDEVEALAQTDGEKSRAARIKRMWQFYRDSASTYQAETGALLHPPQTEADMLALLEQAPEVMARSAERTRLLEAFTPEDGPFKPHFYSRPLLVGTLWGRSLVWSARPWVAKSPRVRAQLTQWAQEPKTNLGRLAGDLLKAAEGKATPVLENAFFEEGLKGWNPNVHAKSEGEFRVANNASAGGANRLVAQGISRGLISQRFAYQPGAYYLSIRCKVPPTYTAGKVLVRFWPSGFSWRDKGYEKIGVALPSQEMSLRAGEESTLEIPFELPANRKIKELNFSIDVTDFPEGEGLSIEEAQIYQISQR